MVYKVRLVIVSIGGSKICEAFWRNGTGKILKSELRSIANSLVEQSTHLKQSFEETNNLL
jgi:hypothetical protein